jgi:hypothetical protein
VKRPRSRNPKGEGNPPPCPKPATPPTPTARLTASLAALTDGPYAAASTEGAADLAAETIRYLNNAAAKGGITDPATIAALTASLATAAYRLPQLLNTISEWLRAETTAGRIADDHRRSPDQLAARNQNQGQSQSQSQNQSVVQEQQTVRLPPPLAL